MTGKGYAAPRGNSQYGGAKPCSEEEHREQKPLVFFFCVFQRLGVSYEKILGAFGHGSNKGTQKILLVKGKTDLNLWSLRLFFLTQSHFSYNLLVSVSRFILRLMPPARPLEENSPAAAQEAGTDDDRTPAWELHWS